MMDEEKFESKKGDKEKTKFVARTIQEAQRIKLEKLMSDPTKPVIIPTTKQKKDFANAIPSFIRNVMGSSAGAGSGEFHVYRHLRRKEYARQKHIQQKSKREQLDEDFEQRLTNNRLQSEEKTAKKRAKRLRKKVNAKNKAKMPKVDKSTEKSDSESDDDDDDENEGVDDGESNTTTEDKSATDNVASCDDKAKHSESEENFTGVSKDNDGTSDTIDEKHQSEPQEMNEAQVTEDVEKVTSSDKEADINK